MTTRIGVGGPSTGVSLGATAARVTAAPGKPFGAMMSAGASAILAGAEGAVQRLPGGPILAAALRSPGGSAAGAGSSASPEGPVGTSSSALSSAGGSAGSAAAASEGEGIEAALNQTANQNLYFLEIQEKISNESRNYSTISNVLKARHDTVKNAIGNIR